MSLLPPLYIIRRNDGAVSDANRDRLAFVPIGWLCRKDAEYEAEALNSLSAESNQGATYEVVELAEALVVH